MQRGMRTSDFPSIQDHDRIKAQWRQIVAADIDDADVVDAWWAKTDLDTLATVLMDYDAQIGVPRGWMFVRT